MNWTEQYRKAFVLSYDDGVWQDVRLVRMLNQYGLKCTFNLNAGLMEPPYLWETDGVRIERMPPEGLPALYKEHGIASHTLHHCDLTQLSDGELFDLARAFIALQSDSPQVFLLWGHSYEFDLQKGWERFERFCDLMAGHDDIFYGTMEQVFSSD